MENKYFNELSREELENTDGGVIPAVLVALAWGFSVGFAGGIAVGIAAR